jgi:hypothetical protein
VPFAHTPYFERREAAKNLPLWSVRLEQPLDVAVPDEPAAQREWGRTMLASVGIQGTNFGVNRQSPTQVNVYSYSFWTSTQVKYFTDRKVVRVEDRRFRWDQFLTGMHSRGGFDQEGWLQDAWGVVVDLVQVAIVVWVASGILMWWPLRAHRRWGALAIGAGVLSFALFVALL